MAALKPQGTLAGWSWDGGETLLAAPGECVFTTVPTSASTLLGSLAAVDPASVGPYLSLSGTSLAAPHVTAAIAHYLSRHADASPAEIRAALIAASRSVASLAGKVVSGDALDLSLLP